MATVIALGGLLVLLVVWISSQRSKRANAIREAVARYLAQPADQQRWAEVLDLTATIRHRTPELTEYLALQARSLLNNVYPPGQVLGILAKFCVPLPGGAAQQELLQALASLIESNSRDEILVQDVLNTMGWIGVGSGHSSWIYGNALRLLEAAPDNPALKRLVLQVGRWHFGRSRPGGVPTTYDEQAMLNDITVRAR